MIVPNLTMINNGTILLDSPNERRLGVKVPVISVEVLPGSDSNVTSLGFTWNATHLDKRELSISLYFKNPELVSQNDVSLTKLTIVDARKYPSEFQ
jgi:hypothetical protein